MSGWRERERGGWMSGWRKREMGGCRVGGGDRGMEGGREERRDYLALGKVK